MIIYYNPECSKCNESLGLLQNNQCEVEIREYLKQPPTESELKDLLKLLGISASELVRTSEPLYKEQFEGKEITDEQWIGILREHPVLIQRPIVIDGSRAVIGRPPVLILDLIR